MMTSSPGARQPPARQGEGRWCRWRRRTHVSLRRSSANSCSNAATSGPCVTHPERIARSAAETSSRPRLRTRNRKKFFRRHWWDVPGSPSSVRFPVPAILLPTWDDVAYQSRRRIETVAQCDRRLEPQKFAGPRTVRRAIVRRLLGAALCSECLRRVGPELPRSSPPGS